MEDSIRKQWEEKFNTCLEIEFFDPSYFKAHHILVPTYMLQIGKYAEPYHEHVVHLLQEFLSSPLETPNKFKRAAISAAFALNTRRTSLINSGAGALLDAEMTILDVRTETSELYCKDVIAWATTVIDAIGAERREDET